MNIPKEKGDDYYGYMNFVYPEKVFDNYKITHGYYSHPAEEG